MTPKDLELAEHQRWRRRNEKFHFKWFDELLENEFAPPSKHRAWLAFSIKEIVCFAVRHVPYYRSLFHEYGLSPTDIEQPEDLTKLPVLTRQNVLDHADSLRAEKLPTGVKYWGYQLSSGTTGNPVKVHITTFQNLFFSILWHRQARWFRFDPEGILCDVRIAADIAPKVDDTRNPDGNIVRHPRWRYLGQFFETGREYGFNLSNDPARQVEWLRELRPTYLMTDPGLMEELALTSNGRSPCDSIQALLGVASQLTDSMRSQLDRFYGVPIHQTYGLNEIGKVALRCDAGRYHVHSEHCHVEIVDENGRPCAPGKEGRIVVTALRNPVMPLIRYDTGDLGTAADGLCPCGRTLPSFAGVAGRYRRYAGLPAGTRERYSAVRRAFEKLSVDDLTFLLQYQLHQFRENRFELRVRTNGPIPRSFREHIQNAWQEHCIPPPTLDIVQVDSISRSPSGKVLDFTSDFYEDSFVRQ